MFTEKNCAQQHPELLRRHPTRGEKFDLAKICMRGKLVANLATKFALSLHASIFEVCNPLDLQQICQRFARVQIHK